MEKHIPGIGAFIAFALILWQSSIHYDRIIDAYEIACMGRDCRSISGATLIMRATIIIAAAGGATMAYQMLKLMRGKP